MSEPKFTPEEAQRIVELSIRLQSQWSDHVSLSEIQKSAAVFGVEPEFVNLAVQQMRSEDPQATPKVGLRTRLSGFQVFLVLFVSIYAFATWFFTVSSATAFGPVRFSDLTPFMVMAAAFGILAGAQRRPWLLAVLPLTAVAMSIVALVFTAISRSFWRPLDYVVEDVFASLVVQVVLLSAGYGLARLVVALQTKTSERSFTG